MTDSNNNRRNTDLVSEMKKEEMLVNFCQKERLVITSTWFKLPKTWKAAIDMDIPQDMECSVVILYNGKHTFWEFLQDFENLSRSWRSNGPYITYHCVAPQTKISMTKTQTPKPDSGILGQDTTRKEISPRLNTTSQKNWRDWSVCHLEWNKISYKWHYTWNEKPKK